MLSDLLVDPHTLVMLAAPTSGRKFARVWQARYGEIKLKSVELTG